MWPLYIDYKSFVKYENKMADLPWSASNRPQKWIAVRSLILFSNLRPVRSGFRMMSQASQSILDIKQMFLHIWKRTYYVYLEFLFHILEGSLIRHLKNICSVNGNNNRLNNILKHQLQQQQQQQQQLHYQQKQQ